MEPDDIYWTARAAVDGLPEVNRDFVIAAMARAILAERRRCADAIIHSCMYGHYASEGTVHAALDKIDANSAELHRGNVENFREFMKNSPPPTFHIVEAGT